VGAEFVADTAASAMPKPHESDTLTPVSQALPTGLAPMLATTQPGLPNEPGWAYEFKWDGWRALARWDGERLTLSGRKGDDLIQRFPAIRGLGPTLPARCILDGEIVPVDASGRPDRSLLQRVRSGEFGGAVTMRPKQGAAVAYLIFDLLWIAADDVRARPYVQRRMLLERLGLTGPAWCLSPRSLDGVGSLREADRQGLEGLIAKRLDSPYRVGERSADWRKVKLGNRDDFVVGGFLPHADRQRIVGLALGYWDRRGPKPLLRYAGIVEQGFSDEERVRLMRFLSPRARPNSPFDEPVQARVQWCAPLLVAECTYREWPRGGVLADPSFLGLRQDKDVSEVVDSRNG
jgi:bifunctional non-homologous end joining protein LigD